MLEISVKITEVVVLLSVIPSPSWPKTKNIYRPNRRYRLTVPSPSRVLADFGGK